MLKLILRTMPVICSLFSFCSAVEFPDLGGVLDFYKPNEISDRVFILTNPKSGSHLLSYSIMKITKRPLRVRIPFWYFENLPFYFPPENLMNYPVDFTKPTTYWGHEFLLLKFLNHSNNKLIFTLRNYKDNIPSAFFSRQIELEIPCDEEPDLDSILLKEVTQEGPVFKGYIKRLKIFDRWNSDNRLLVLFDDLVDNPLRFIPDVMSFIEDDSEYMDFIDHYEEFKVDLLKQRRTVDLLKHRRTANLLKHRRAMLHSTEAGAKTNYFSKKISPEILQVVDQYIEEHYPELWERYLKRFSEEELMKNHNHD